MRFFCFDGLYSGRVATCAAFADAIGSLIAASSFNILFPLSLDFFPQLVYLIICLLMIVPLLSLVAVHFIRCRHRKVAPTDAA